MTLFSLKMMLLVLNVNRTCLIRAPDMINNITVFLTRVLNCNLLLESILPCLSKIGMSHIFTYLGRRGYLLYMPFKFRETRGCSDYFRYPLIVRKLDTTMRAANNPLYKQPLRYIPCMNVNTVFTSGE